MAFILNLEPGLQVAVRHRYASERGVIKVVSKGRVTVAMTNGTLRHFSPNSKLEIGATGHKWMRPYLCTVGEAEEADRKIAAAHAQAGDRIASGKMLDWSVLKGNSWEALR